MNRLLLLFPATALWACSMTAELPEGEGPGLVTIVPRNAAAGIKTYPRPELSLGDRFIYSVGAGKRLPTRIIQADENGYHIMEEGANQVIVYDRDLGRKSFVNPSNPDALRVMAPADSLFAWPLWVGKRWTCIYVQKGPKLETREIVASYHIDAMETIKVQAGEFECLRIWRRAKPTRGEFYRESTVYWYSPKVGFWVRKLESGRETELVDYERQ